MQNPGLYFRNNVANTAVLLEAMRAHAVDRIVFSSSCATYGYLETVPVAEDHRQSPVSPYGESKLMVERMLYWFARIHGFRAVALRYFNAAGADPEGEIGETHDPETHLIPRAIQAALGCGPMLDLYGDDYPTPDGSAVRDYIHVSDLATAHVAALGHLEHAEGLLAFNLGAGVGHSVKQVIAMVEAVGGRSVPCRVTARRPGDPAALIADARRATDVLRWQPQLSSLRTIVETAWAWQVKSTAPRAG
jgi:UDP-glucose-4-epimerase GalE